MKLKMKKEHLVLLPGMDGTGNLFEPLLHALPNDFEPAVVRFPPGKKLNYQQLFPTLREAIPWGEPYTLVAESFSGPLALLFAEQQRQDIKAIVLCATFAKNPAPPGLTPLISALAPRVFKSRPRPSILRFFATGPNATPALTGLLQATMESLDPEVMIHRLQTVIQTDATAALQAFTRPLLYLRATHDRIVPKAASDYIKHIKPDLQSVDIDSSHLLLQTHPSQAIAAITGFLQNIE